MTQASSPAAAPVNPALLRAVRQRMAEQSDEELLRIWVENDRVHWSPETFEAVRSVLAERGVPLPAQNDPPPMAAKRNLLKDLDPATDYWLGWLRPVLRLGVVLAVIELAYGVWYLVAHVAYLSSLTTLDEWLDALYSQTVLYLVASLFLPACMLIGAWHARRLRPAGHWWLLVYCVASFVWTGVQLRFSVMEAASENTPEAWHDQAGIWTFHAYSTAYPVLLLLFLRRTEIRQLFHPVGPAFQVKQ